MQQQTTFGQRRNLLVRNTHANQRRLSLDVALQRDFVGGVDTWIAQQIRQRPVGGGIAFGSRPPVQRQHLAAGVFKIVGKAA